MYTNKLGVEVGCCTRSMSKKDEGKSGDSINSSKSSSIQSKEISPKSKSKDNTENIVEKIRPSTPRGCKKSINYSTIKTDSNHATDSPGPLTRGKRKSLSVRSSVRNISDYFEKEQPKYYDKINEITDKKVDVEKSGIDKKTTVLSDNNNHITNSSDLTKKKLSCKNIFVVLRRASENMLENYSNLEDDKDDSKKLTNKDKNYDHNTSKESLGDMADNITRSDDIKRSNNDSAKKSSNDLKSVSPSNKNVSENNDLISSLNKGNSSNNSINSEDLKPLNNSVSNLPEKKEKGDEKVVEFEVKKTDESIERIDNFKEKSSSFSPKQLDDEKSKINKQIESSTKETDIEKPTTPIKSSSFKKTFESPEKLSPATCTGETSIKSVEKCHLGRKVEKAEILNAVIKIESLTRNPIGNEKEEHDSKGKFCDDSDDIISPQEFLKDVFNKSERNLLENKKAFSRVSDKNENCLSVVKEKTEDESNLVENVQETTKSKSSSINIESEENDTKSKTENAIVIVENEKPITDSESATNIFEDKTGKQEKESYVRKSDVIDKEKEKQESSVEKKDDTVPNDSSSSTRTHAENQALTKNKRKTIDATVSESDVSENKPTSKSNTNTSDNSQQLVVTSITTDNVPKAKRLSSSGKDAGAVESSPQKKQQEELKETGQTMIEADNISSFSDKNNPNTPNKQSTARNTNETSLVEENKVVSDSCANDLESHKRMSVNEKEKVKNESSIRSPNTSIRIIDLQEDSSMSGVEEIPEIVIREEKSASVVDNKNKDFSTESNSEIISTGASANEHSEVIDVIDDIPINVNRTRTSGKRSFDDESDISDNEEQSLRSFSKNKKVKCTEKEDDEKNTSGEDNEIESSKIGDESIVSCRDVNEEEEANIEQGKDREGSLNIDDKDVPPTKASFVKPAEEGVAEIVDKDVVDVESSESSDKNIDSRNVDDEPQDDEVEKDGESKGTEDENIALGKAFLNAEPEEGPKKNFLNEVEGENIEKIMVDESSDSDSSNIVSAKHFLDDEAAEGEEEIVYEVMDEESDESDSSDIVSENNFLDDEGKKDKDDESDSIDDREILSGKDFLDEEAEEGDEEIGVDTDDASDDTDDDDIISGKYFLEEESDENEEKNYSEEISEEYSKTVKNPISKLNIIKDKAKKTKEKVNIQMKKVKNIAENGNGNEEVLSNNSGETVSNDEIVYLDKNEESERICVLKTTISRSDETKSISHLNDKGCWTVTSVKGSSKIKIFNNKVCTNNIKFVATDIDSNKKSFRETNLSLSNNLNWIISTVREDKDISDSKKKSKKLNQLKRRLESITEKETSSVSSSVQPSTKDELIVQENPDLYDSLLLKRKRSKKKSTENTVKENNIEELLEYFGTSATAEGTKSLSMPSTSGKTKESIKNTLALKLCKEEENVPKMQNLDEQNEEMRMSLKRFSDAIEGYKKKLKVTHNPDKMDKNDLRNTNETPLGVESKKYPYRITVGNVPESVLPNELKSTFSQVGFNDIVTVSPIMDDVEMKFAVVTFSSRNSQQRALEYYGQLFLKGNPLFPMQCHQDDDVASEERDTHKSNQNPTAELQKYGKAQKIYKVSKNDNHSKDKSELAIDMSGVSQNRNLEQSINHISKQKSKQKNVIAKNSKSDMNKTDDIKELSQKKTNLKDNVVHLSRSKENAPAARKISGNTDLTTKMGGSQCNSVNIKCLGSIRPTIKEVKEAFSVVGVTDVKCINQVSKKVTSVEFASKKSVEKLLSYSGKIVINGMPVLIKKNTLQSSLDLPSTSTANLESKKINKLRNQHTVKTVIDKEQNSDTAAQNRPKDFSLIIKNLPTNASNTNVRKALLNLGIKGIIKVIIKRDENVSKDKLTGVVTFFNENFYLNALNTRNILLNGSQVKFSTKKDKKD